MIVEYGKCNLGHCFIDQKARMANLVNKKNFELKNVCIKNKAEYLDSCYGDIECESNKY